MKNFFAFTMAEILLSLTIIGVVAAITLPSLTGNINERTWNTQRKALYARMSQAIALMPALNGYGTYTYDETTSTTTEDTAAETFITNGLAKVIKINNICDSEHLADCGIVSSYVNHTGNKKSFPTTLKELNEKFTEPTTYLDSVYQNPQSNINTKAAAFETANGESIAAFYNPTCQTDSKELTGTSGYFYAAPKMCVNFIYDLNGSKGPNTVGKDIGFITVLYATDSKVVAPMPYSSKDYDGDDRVIHQAAASVCNNLSADSRLPNIEELMSMFYNTDLLGMQLNSHAYWSGTVTSSTNACRMRSITGEIRCDSKTSTYLVRCIKR